LTSELANYLERIEDLHGQMAGLVSGLTQEALNWRPIEGDGEPVTNSLAVLVTHSTAAEHFWIGEVVGGLPPTRDRKAEFAKVASSSAELTRLLETTALETREVFSQLKDTDLSEPRRAEGRALPVRWCLLHVVDHTSLHLGQMQITFQLWAGGKSHPSPLWHERLHPGPEGGRRLPHCASDRSGDEVV
jgi:uncharacterized damage-inducible protein DinB